MFETIPDAKLRNLMLTGFLIGTHVLHPPFETGLPPMVYKHVSVGHRCIYVRKDSRCISSIEVPCSHCCRVMSLVLSEYMTTDLWGLRVFSLRSTSFSTDSSNCTTLLWHQFLPDAHWYPRQDYSTMFHQVFLLFQSFLNVVNKKTKFRFFDLTYIFSSSNFRERTGFVFFLS